jgi:arabinogalactan endo-1,4-beta-galactosidase
MVSVQYSINRRGVVMFISAALAVLVGVLVILASAVSYSTSGALRIRGADVSFTLQNEAANNVLSEGEGVQPIETILAAHGANYVRLRVWVDPAEGGHDLDATLQLAARAKAAGLRIVLDLHYSDDWADRTTQTTPSAWERQNPRELAVTVENYTRSVLDSLAAQGTPADIVQLGNEVIFGMLWPVGQIYGVRGEYWDGFTDLLQAAVRGARASESSDSLEIMLDIDTGGDADQSTYFFDHIEAAGIDYDLIGLTYYPFWQGSLADLEQNLHTLATRYDKNILIAETAYPWTLEDADDEPNVVSSLAELPDGALYPPTPSGQRQFYQALREVLAEVPGSHGAGFLVWEPGWLAGVNASADLGNAYDNLTLFDAEGVGLPALDAFAEP